MRDGAQFSPFVPLSFPLRVPINYLVKRESFSDIPEMIKFTKNRYLEEHLGSSTNYFTNFHDLVNLFYSRRKS